MKIVTGMTGRTVAQPDYGMLKAALIAAQAATPTARASGARDSAIDPHAALHALFATQGGEQGPADALGHRFSLEAPEGDDEAAAGEDAHK